MMRELIADARMLAADFKTAWRAVRELRDGAGHPGYVIGHHWMSAAYSRICAGDDEEHVMADFGWTRRRR